MSDYKVPCGRTIGHGEFCSEGWLCAACTEIQRLRDTVAAYKAAECNDPYLWPVQVENKQQAEEIQQLRNPWIPVTERLPEHNQLVLIWEGNGVHFGRWHKGINDWLFYSPTWPRELTHWMPLPEPPQQEKGKND